MFKVKRTIRIIIVVSLLAGMIPAAAAAEVTVRARVDHTDTRVNEPVTYILEVTSTHKILPDPSWPETDEYDVFSMGRSHSYDVENGRMTSIIRFDYSIVPKTDGPLTLGPVELKIDNQTYRTTPITIAVERPARTPRSDAAQTSSKTARDSAPPHRLFAEAELDREHALVNQRVTLTLRLYCAEKLRALSVAEPPSLADFWVEELLPWRKDYRMIDGTRYELTEIDYALFPISAGTREIGASRLTARIEQRDRAFAREDYISLTPVELYTSALTLDVRALPVENRPADFSGLVGVFTISAEYDRTAAPVNEPITARVTISGRGNIKSITEPKIDAPPDVRAHIAGFTEKINTAGYQVRGSKTFNQVFVPRREGRVEIPGFSISYYDPSQKIYVTRRTSPVMLAVAGSASALSEATAEVQEIEALDQDIRFLKSGSGSFSRASGGYSYALLALLHIVPLTGLGIVLFTRRHKNRPELVGSPGNRRRMNREIHNGLARAKRYAESGDVGRFYPTISTALTLGLATWFDGPAVGPTRSEISRAFADAGVQPEVQAEFVEILDACDYGRFTPEQSNMETMRAVRQRAVVLINRLEKSASKV